VRDLRPCRRHRFAARFAQAERGSVAIEFGLIVLPFFTLMFALIELGMVLLAFSSMETATDIAARRIRTGEFQQAIGHSSTDFKNLVCGRMTWLHSQCTSNLYVDVRTYNDFATLAASQPKPAATFGNNAGACFTAGNPTDIVLVRVYFKWQLLTPFLDHMFENMGTGSGYRLMSVATAFRNEPYNDSGPLGAKC
jgi:Flp pilus assembly protein TadG